MAAPIASISFQFKDANGNPVQGQTIPIDAFGGLPTTRTAWTTSAPITPGTPVSAGRAVFFATSQAGSVRVKLSSGSTLDVPVSVGASLIDNLAVVDVVAANTTATTTVTVLS